MLHHLITHFKHLTPGHLVDCASWPRLIKATKDPRLVCSHNCVFSCSEYVVPDDKIPPIATDPFSYSCVILHFFCISNPNYSLHCTEKNWVTAVVDCKLFCNWCVAIAIVTWAELKENGRRMMSVWTEITIIYKGSHRVSLIRSLVILSNWNVSHCGNGRPLKMKISIETKEFEEKKFVVTINKVIITTGGSYKRG